jgi:glycosyltransferase involved in cell wall biosynthesis
MKRKILIFTTHPIQYQVPLFKLLSKNKNLNVKVIYASNHGAINSIDKDFQVKFSWDINMFNGYNYEILEKKINVNSFFLNTNKIYSKFREKKIDLCLILGWNNLFYLKAIFWSFFFGVPIIARAESNLLKKDSLIKKTLKKIVFYIFFKLFHKFLYIGKANYDFYKNYGVSKEKLIPGPYSVDNNFFNNLKNNKIKIKSELKISKNKIIYIFSGKFIPRKRPLDILYAILDLKEKKLNYHFIFIGDGQQKKECIDFSKKNCLSNITFLGFVNQRKIREYYAIADIIIMPSEYETWGLAVNEAMASGCACIVSNKCGCFKDLVYTRGEKKNGFVYQVGDIEKIKELFIFFDKNKKKIKNMKKNSLSIIQNFNLKKTSESIASFLKNEY